MPNVCFMRKCHVNTYFHALNIELTSDITRVTETQ